MEEKHSFPLRPRDDACTRMAKLDGAVVSRRHKVMLKLDVP